MAPTADFCIPWRNPRIRAIIVLFVIIIITTIITTTVKEAAMIVFEIPPRRCTEHMPSSEGRNSTRRVLAWIHGLLWTCRTRCEGEESWTLQQPDWANGLTVMRSTFPYIAQHAFNKLWPARCKTTLA